MAEILNEKGDYKLAKEHLSQAFKIGRMMRSSLVQYMCLLTEAYMRLKCRTRKLEKEGLKSLRKAMALGRKQGFINTFGWRLAVMTELCMKALEEGIEIDYVTELIRRRNLSPEKPPINIENWPWPLKIFTLGRFGVLKDGKPLRFSKKVQQRPLDLLKVLIALGGRDVREEQLADVLWPEAYTEPSL